MKFGSRRSLPENVLQTVQVLENRLGCVLNRHLTFGGDEGFVHFGLLCPRRCTIAHAAVGRRACYWTR